ncbi:MAG: cobalamin-dependent protein [Candidatus Krumholzibacteriota bacterium]
MEELLERLAVCIEHGKVDADSPYPPELKGQEGATELTRRALAAGCPPREVLAGGLMTGMGRVGDRFEKGEAFIPELLIAARAMTASMELLKPYFESGDIEYRGKVILGTVAGDLHDIGKNIVRMVLEGDGWEVIDLGVDVTTEQFLDTLAGNPGSLVGLSALLTTTMINMERTTAEIQVKYPGTPVFVGGAPLSDEFCAKIGASGYFQDPQKFAKHLRGPADTEGGD